MSHLEWVSYVDKIACLLRFEDYREVLDLVLELFVASFASVNKTFKGLIDWLRVCTPRRLSYVRRLQAILFYCIIMSTLWSKLAKA